MDTAEKVLLGIVILLLGIFIFLFTLVGVMANTEIKCKALGYKDMSVTFSFDRYCESRINQSDIVIPLKEAKLNPIK